MLEIFETSFWKILSKIIIKWYLSTTCFENLILRNKLRKSNCEKSKVMFRKLNFVTFGIKKKKTANDTHYNPQNHQLQKPSL